jgi:predicted N-formylglutamate amidohydrolase
MPGSEPQRQSYLRFLADTDPRAFELVNVKGRSRVVLVCEHAGIKVPAILGDLGLPQSDLRRHIGWDIGAVGLSRELSSFLDAPLVLQPYSRLVIDCNRPFGAPDSIPTVSDTTIIPANQSLSDAERMERYEAIHVPFHQQVKALLDAHHSGEQTILVTVHSFTPVMLSEGRKRPWHLGVLYNRDERFARKLMKAALALKPDLPAAFNQPYQISDTSDYAIPVHGEARGIEHVMLEMRNDLIADAAGQKEWSGFLAAAIRDAIND